MKTAQLADPDLVVPAAQRARYEESFARFADVFPERSMSGTRQVLPDNSADAGRLLSAGYHSVMGFWRDDNPLVELILDEEGKRNWTALDGVRLLRQSHRPGRSFSSTSIKPARFRAAAPRRPCCVPVGREVTDSSVIAEVRDQYVALAKASGNADRRGLDASALSIASTRRFGRSRRCAPPLNRFSWKRWRPFAARAYRRPLTKGERDGLLAYYQKLRKQGALSHEDAMRDSVASILDFSGIPLSRRSAGSGRGCPGFGAVPSGNPALGYDLASRLSYFLWSSMPDQELLNHAAAGDLSRPDVLIAQARRMLKDPRSRGLATEFAASWLDSRHFETFNSVDRERFPTFTNDLREAMFEEPVRFVEDVIRNNRSVLDLLYGNYTFVNPVLANHYGIPGVTGKKDDWVRVDDAGRYERGGLLPMAVFLTQSSPGLRTSPVKRGFGWCAGSWAR
jgi:hypothetical protein